MKIISMFQDYYDIGIAYGVDEKLRFKRKTKYIDESRYHDSHVVYIYYHKHSYYRMMFYHYTMGFCGKRYPFVRVEVEKIDVTLHEKVYTLVDSEYFYSLEILDHWLKERFESNHEFVVGSYNYNGYEENKKRIKIKQFVLNAKEFFDKKKFHQEAVFKKHHVPYFLVEYDYVMDDKKPYIKYQTILLPQLKKYRFTQVMPPMQAFQEISMYLGKLNAVEDNMVTIEDKYLAQGKGFDCYSFKKMPSKRKEKRC